jgi:hypothetical protein
MKKRRRIILVVVVVCCYAAGPCLAGAFRLGDRLGPALYPESFYSGLYVLAHEATHNEKPRIPLDSWMYRRPFFYGFSRRLKSAEERAACIDMARRNESPALEWMAKMNQEVQEAQAFSAPKEQPQTSPGQRPGLTNQNDDEP